MLKYYFDLNKQEMVIKIMSSTKMLEDDNVVEFLDCLNSDKNMAPDQWIKVLSKKCSDGKLLLYEKLRQELDFCWYDPVLAYLEMPQELKHLCDPVETVHFNQLYDEKKTVEVRYIVW